MQPPYAGGGYPIPPRPGSSGSSTLVIVIVVVVGLLVLGAGACAAGAFVLFGVSAAPGPHGKPLPTAEPVVTEEPEDPEPPAPPVAPAPPPAKPVGPPKKGPRTVDFVCPPGKPPGGTVRAGCMCGSEILGTACGASGFSDVIATAKGCRFTCE